MTPKIISSTAQTIHVPTISTLLVQQALDALNFKTPASSALDNLCMVDCMLVDPLSLPSSNSKEALFTDILVAFITYDLLELRAQYHLPPPVFEASIEQIEMAIIADAETGNAGLIGVSYLFYRYVCRTVCVTREWFASVAGLDENTVDRCYDNALGWLTQKLADEESVACDRRHRDRFAASLPSQLHTIFVGREDDLARTMRWISAPVRHHIQVFGKPGIGKTAFVCEIAKRLIEMDHIDDFVWLQNAYSVGEIQQSFHQIQENHFQKPKEQYRTLYVFDNFICPGDELAEFSVLLEHLSSSIVFVTTRSPIPTMDRISLSELDKVDAISLIGTLLKFHDITSESILQNDAVEDIWNHTGGLPNAIESFIMQEYQRS